MSMMKTPPTETNSAHFKYCFSFIKNVCLPAIKPTGTEETFMLLKQKRLIN